MGFFEDPVRNPLFVFVILQLEYYIASSDENHEERFLRDNFKSIEQNMYCFEKFSVTC